MPGGRPPIISSPQEFEERANRYFEACDKGRTTEVYDKRKQEVHIITKEIPYTVPGLCRAVGFSSRDALSEYGAKPEYTDTIKSIRQRIEEQRVERMLSNDVNVIGAIFDLKNNFGYTDKQEIEYTDRSRRQIDAGQSEVKEILEEIAKRKRSLLKVVKPIK